MTNIDLIPDCGEEKHRYISKYPDTSLTTFCRTTNYILNERPSSDVTKKGNVITITGNNRKGENCITALLLRSIRIREKNFKKLMQGCHFSSEVFTPDISRFPRQNFSCFSDKISNVLRPSFADVGK